MAPIVVDTEPVVATSPRQSAARMQRDRRSDNPSERPRQPFSLRSPFLRVTPVPARQHNREDTEYVRSHGLSDFGDDRTFYNADTGWTSKEESVPYLTDAGSSYDTGSNTAYAYAFTNPTAVPIHASGTATISEILYPSGSLSETYERYAECSISGEFQSRIAAYGSASANYSIEIFLVDASNNQEIDRHTIKDKNASFAHFSDVDNETFEESVSGTIQQYTEYRVGVQVNTFAANRTIPSAPTPFASGANVSNEEVFAGFATWDSVDLNWIGEAEVA